MRLTIATPLAILLETGDVVHPRAEDETGSFGILAGHADFLTVLSVSVVTWRGQRGAEHHAAVRGGMLEVRGGDEIAIATPEAVLDDDLHRLGIDVLAGFRRASAKSRPRARTPSVSTLPRSGRSIAFSDPGRGQPCPAAPACAAPLDRSYDGAVIARKAQTPGTSRRGGTETPGAARLVATRGRALDWAEPEDDWRTGLDYRRS